MNEIVKELEKQVVQAARENFYYQLGQLAERFQTMSSEQQKAESTPRKQRNITFNDTPMDVPPLVKESIYPWDKLADAKPLMTSFFVECDSKEEADTLRQSVYASGRTFYQKRGIQLRPVVRVLQMGDKWGVNAWATIDEGEDEEAGEQQ